MDLSTNSLPHTHALVSKCTDTFKQYLTREQVYHMLFTHVFAFRHVRVDICSAGCFPLPVVNRDSGTLHQFVLAMFGRHTLKLRIITDPNARSVQLEASLRQLGVLQSRGR